MWNVDHMFCDTVRRVRSDVPAALRPLTQLHGWWHVGAGYATYIQVRPYVCESLIAETRVAHATGLREIV